MEEAIFEGTRKIPIKMYPPYFLPRQRRLFASLKFKLTAIVASISAWRENAAINPNPRSGPVVALAINRATKGVMVSYLVGLAEMDLN